jgi:hypothetical protein
MTSPEYKFGTWYDISSAPKEGTDILAWNGNSHHIVSSHGFDHDEKRGHAWFNGDVYINGITHWMPLPPPPPQSIEGE